MALQDTINEASRVLTVCNACRYCEGYCPVFPAMERRLEFATADLSYLANLCHQCQACYYACQYAPPHEFSVNVPRALAELRRESWSDYVWPAALRPLLERGAVWAALATAACLSFFIVATALFVDAAVLFGVHRGPGAFYAVIGHEVMIALFGAVFLYVVLALGIGATRFVRQIRNPALGPAAPGDWRQAISDAATLRHLGGGGDGCTYPGERPSGTRRVYHHFMAYGFLLCFAATLAGTVYHYGFGFEAPHGWLSVPVMLGTLGGIGLLIGPAGLLWLKGRADPAPADMGAQPMDRALLWLLLLTSATGFALLLFRETAAMGTLLAVHLGVVLALFLTLPYGRFVHAVYRFAALLHYSIELRRLKPTGAGD